MRPRPGKLVVGVLAALVLSSAFAAAAQAEGKFTAAEYPAQLNPAQIGNAVLKIPIAGPLFREVTCSKTEYAAPTLASAQEKVQVQPSYASCLSRQVSGESTGSTVPTTVAMNGCSYTWAVVELLSATTAKETATIDCPAGKEIEIKAYADEAEHGKGVTICEYRIAPQGPLGSIESHNLGSGSSADVELTMNLGPSVKIIKGAKLVCGTLESTVTGNLSGNVTLSGTKSGLPVGVSID